MIHLTPSLAPVWARMMRAREQHQKNPDVVTLRARVIAAAEWRQTRGVVVQEFCAQFGVVDCAPFGIAQLRDPAVRCGVVWPGDRSAFANPTYFCAADPAERPHAIVVAVPAPDYAACRRLAVRQELHFVPISEAWAAPGEMLGGVFFRQGVMST